MKQAINIRLEKEMLNSLDGYATELAKTRTSLIEKAIDAYFNKLDEMVADRRIDALKRGETEVIPLKEVFAKAGIDVLGFPEMVFEVAHVDWIKADRVRHAVLAPLRAGRGNAPAVHARQRLQDDELAVICVGQLIPRKGQVVLLNAWSSVLEGFPRARLIVCCSNVCLL